MTTGGRTLATEKLYNIFAREGGIHPPPYHLLLQLSNLTHQRVKLLLQALVALPHLVGILHDPLVILRLDNLTDFPDDLDDPPRMPQPLPP